MISFPSKLGNIFLGNPAEGLGKMIHDLHPSRIITVADENTAEACLPKLVSHFDGHGSVIIPAGEKHKSLDSCSAIWTALVKGGTDRNSLIINLGGGMICDLGGFAAACYQRGIRFIHIPTSLLAMADAAIGGKTGIDFTGLKNYIGSFTCPEFIWIYPGFLETLPAQEVKSGLSEIVKHAIIGSHELWTLLEAMEGPEQMNWDEILEKNIPVKVNVVEADPSEKGLRKILNFGHTIGHALESWFLAHDIPVSHGQCVATGMLVESKISNELGLLNSGDFNVIVLLIDRLLDPVREPLPNFEDIYTGITLDKKKKMERVGFSLPDRIGSCGWDIPVEKNILERSYSWMAQAMTASGRLKG